MLVRAFSKLAELVQIPSKYKLPGLTAEDPLQLEKNVQSMFEKLLSEARPNPKLPNRPLLPKSGLNKLSILSTNPDDCEVLLQAYWTYCGHKIWPSNGSAQIIAQTCINLEVPEKAADFFLYSKQLRFIPNLKLVNRFLKSLYEKKDWLLILQVFKQIEPRIHIKKDETSYIIALAACKELKKWKWSYRFMKSGKEKMSFSPVFFEAVQELASDLSEEERMKFLFADKNNS